LEAEREGGMWWTRKRTQGSDRGHDGECDVGGRERCLATGMDAYDSKPVREQKI
jgi:hypothetical protein